jgi:hypothetical protein
MSHVGKRNHPADHPTNQRRSNKGFGNTPGMIDHEAKKVVGWSFFINGDDGLC